MDINVVDSKDALNGTLPSPTVAIFTNPQGNPAQARKLPGLNKALGELGIKTIIKIDCSRISACELDKILPGVDGAIVLGDNSMLHPHNYGKLPLKKLRQKFSRMRDATTLRVINYCVKEDVPLLAICRGFQELVSAMGGSLVQDVSSVARNVDHEYGYRHKGHKKAYSGVHPIILDRAACWPIIAWNHAAPQLVNSLHKKCAVILNVTKVQTVEAWRVKVAEAVSHRDKRFVFATQFHIEQAPNDPFSHKIFKRFTERVASFACEKRAAPTLQQKVSRSPWRADSCLKTMNRQAKF